MTNNRDSIFSFIIRFVKQVDGAYLLKMRYGKVVEQVLAFAVAELFLIWVEGNSRSTGHNRDARHCCCEAERSEVTS